MKKYCPNINSPEWIALEEAVGRFEAMKDWMENDGEIRSPEVVISEKKINRESFPVNSMEFELRTLSAMHEFLNEAGIDIRMIPGLQSREGQSVLAAANFINLTVDINDDLQKRPDAWNKLPEEAAHWWYRLLNENSVLKKQLLNSVETGHKVLELQDKGYESLDLTEEAIGQLIAEAIKRVEDKTATEKDYSFLKAFVEWINKLLTKFNRALQDPFEVAAIRILSGDLTDLLTLDEYTYLMYETYGEKVSENAIKNEDLHEFIYKTKASNEYIQKLIHKRSRFLPKFLDKFIRKNTPVPGIVYEEPAQLRADFISDVLNTRSSKLVEEDYIKDELRNKYANLPGLFNKPTEKMLNDLEQDFITKDYRIITPTLSNIDTIKNKYRNKPISLGQKFVLQGAKKEELSIYNNVLDLIKKENPKLRSISAEDFINEVLVFLSSVKQQAIIRENYHDGYNVAKTFRIVKANTINPEVQLSDNVNKFLEAVAEFGENSVEAKEISNTLNIEERNQLLDYLTLQNYTGDVKHNKYTIRSLSAVPNYTTLKKLDSRYHDYSSASYWPVSAFVSLTDFYSNSSSKKDATLLHEIQNNQFEALLRVLNSDDNINTAKDEINRRGESYLRNLSDNLIKNNNLYSGNWSRWTHNSLFDKNNNIVHQLMLIIDQQGSIPNKYNSFMEKINEQVELNKGLKKQLKLNLEQALNMKDAAFIYKLQLGEIKNRLKHYVSEKDVKIYNNPATKPEERDNILTSIQQNINRDWGLKPEELGGEILFKKFYKKSDTHADDTQRNEPLEDFLNLRFVLNSNINNIIRKHEFTITRIKKDLNIVFNTLESTRSYEKVSKMTFEQFEKIVDTFTYNENLLKDEIDKKVYKLNSGTGAVSGIEEYNSAILDNIETVSKVKEYLLGMVLDDDFTTSFDKDLVKEQLKLSQVLVQDAINTHIKEKGRDFPLYFSGYEITTLTQHSLDSARLYAGPEEVAKGLTKKVGPMYSMISKIPGITLEYVDNIPGFKQDVGGYKVNLDNYKQPAPILYALDQKTIDFSREGTQSISFKEDSSSGYKARTEKNASADATIAIAVDFTSAGERLTKSSVQKQGKKYIPINANDDVLTQERVDKAVDKLNSVNAKTLNIAGNGIYTMKGKYTQQQVDDFTYELLKNIINSPRLKNKIISIRTGGQTGFDEAGAKAGIRLGIPTSILAPKGWKYRDESGKDLSGETQFKARFSNNVPTKTQAKSKESIYNKLGNKTKSSNVIIKGVYQERGVEFAKSIGGVFSMRRDASNKHFGNPFSSIKKEIDKGLSPTKSTKESVEKYIDWVINSNESRAQWIREQLKSGDLKGKPIVYYKELGEPSHATALDYLINQYPWKSETKSSKLSYLQDRVERYLYNFNLNPKTKVISSNLSDENVNKINRVIRAMRPAERWHLVKSSKGNWFVAGNKGQNVLYPDYTPKPASFFRESLSDYDNSVLLDNNSEPLNEPEQKTDMSLQAIGKMADKLSQQLGVKYAIITPTEAEELTKDTVKWNGEKGFFLNDTVYLLGDRLDPNVAFHEFSHPFVKALQNKNKALFYKLYGELAFTPEGERIIKETKELYGDYLDFDSDRFKEEVIVKAMTLAANTTDNTPGFIKWLKEIFYQIKQLLRGQWGKIDISKLDFNTTIERLSEMLMKGSKFTLNNTSISDKDLAEYYREQQAEIDDLTSIKDKGNYQDLVDLATLGVKTANKALRKIKDSKDHTKMLEVLSDEYGASNLREIKANLRNYTEDIEKRLSETIDKVKYTQSHIEALVNTYFRVSKMINKINKHLDELVEKANDPDSIMKVFSYRKVLDFWGEFAIHTLDVFDKNQVGPTNAMSKLVSSIRDDVERAEKKVSKINAEAVKDVLYNILLPINDKMEERFNSMLATYKKGNFKQYAIDRLYKEFYGLTESEYKELEKLESISAIVSPKYTELKAKSFEGANITKEKIELLLKGELGDVKWFSSLLEGYLYNEDPIVGGFSLYVKEAIDEVRIRSQAKYNEFAKEIVPLLEASGYNPSNIGELGKKVGFVEKILIPEEHGSDKLIEKEIWTFLNKFKGYRYRITQLSDNVKKAAESYRFSNSKTNKETYLNAINEKHIHDMQFMHQENVPEYYTVRDEFVKSHPLALEALERRDQVLEEIRGLQERAYEEDQYLDVSVEIDNLWLKYNQLHSLYDRNGKLKVDSFIASVDGTKEEIESNDLTIATLLKEYRDKIRKFSTWDKMEPAFQLAFQKYKQSLHDKLIFGAEFDEHVALWLDKNTRVAIKPEFYAERERILTRIKEILATQPKAEESSEKVADAYSEIFDLSGGYRDNFNQIEAPLMTPAKLKRIKELEEIIEAEKDNSLKGSGLTRKQEIRYYDLKDNEDYLSDKEIAELTELEGKRKKGSSGLGKELGKELSARFSELANLSSSNPTDYYVDQLNGVLQELPEALQKLVEKKFKNIELDYYQADKLIKPQSKSLLNKLLKNSAFADWFHKTHIPIKTYSKESSKYITTYKRTYVWNVVEPNDEFYLEKQDIVEDGKVVDTIYRIPSLRFYKRVVKDEYKTGYDPATKEVNPIIGTHIDNKGQWLPREDVPDSPYRNEEYYTLEKEDPKLFKVLEKLKEYHLKHQEKLNFNGKLYYDFPRYQKSNLELIQTGKGIKGVGDAIRLFLERIRQFFKGSKEEPESGYKWEDDFTMASIDIYESDDRKIPLSGLYDIDINDVSTDITNGLVRYMMSAEHNSKLNEIHPTALAVKSVVENNGGDLFRRISSKNMVNRGQFNYNNKKGNERRKKVIGNFIDREFYGQTLTGLGSDSKGLFNAANGAFSIASFSFFATNIPSALKNAIGAKIQGFIESAAGRYFNMADFARAEGWTTKTMMELSAQIYKKGPKSKDVQLWEVFDPIVNFTDKAQKEGLSRTVLKDITKPVSVLLNFRKWSEMHASMQIFSAMMYHTKVKQGEKTIPWIDAWEVIDGKIQLKKGVDPTWGITYNAEGEMLIGEKFKKERQVIQAVERNLQGAYDQFNQPEAQRYLAFKFVSFLRKYFTTMLVERFGFRGSILNPRARLQPGLGTLAEGWYVSMARYIFDVFRMGPKRMVFMTPDERRAFLKGGVDIAVISLSLLLQSLVFGWDDDDPDRFKKLREKSGALRGPFVNDDEYDFHMGGWLSNHALSLLMQVRSEQNQFLPIPGLGLDEYNQILTDIGGSAAFGPTLNTYFNIIQDTYWMTTGNDNAYYKREVGPYEWQQADGSKLLNHMAKSVGFTGTTMDPGLSIKNFTTVQGFR